MTSRFPPFAFVELVSKYNKRNIRRWPEDMNFMLSWEEQWALTIWMEFSVIPGRIQMERFIPVEIFQKKGNTFRGISFFPLLPEFPKISLLFVHSYSARLFTVILLRKKIWKMAADFQNVCSYYVCLCSSIVLADVLEHNCNPAGENELRFCGRYLCFSFTFQRASAWATSWEKMWMLIAGFPDEMWMLQQFERRNCRLLQKEKSNLQVVR